MSSEKEFTLIFVRKVSEDGKKMVLLGMKKRGFGAGKWNGFGGKIEEGESNEDGAMRELMEECSLQTTSLSRRGYLVFHMEESNKVLKVHVYETFQFSGEIVESSEMRPQWFEESEIPYDGMWPDDKLWLPQVLAGSSVLGRFEYSDDNTIEDYSVKIQ
jgi:8-oxo-dGTP diphosphatase / 2-hydroxy-dATP diphosphatase